jgi:plasmid replication initiation protein
VLKSSPVTPDGWHSWKRGDRKIRRYTGIRCVQSELRTYLARIQKTSPRVGLAETSHLGLRSHHALRLYALAKKHVTAGKKRITLEQLRKLLGLESVKDAEVNIIQEAPLPIWANFRQRALDVAILEINKKTDISIEVESLERSKHRRVTTVIFAIEDQAVPDGD